jgi:leucyl aminopeptidase
MKFAFRSGTAALSSASTIAIGIHQGARRLEGVAAALDRSSGGMLAALLASGDFTGRALETAVVHPARGKTRRVIVIGCGPRNEDSPRHAFEAAAIATRRARELRAGSLVLALPWTGAPARDAVRARAMAEGAMLGHWRHTAYLRDPGAPALRRVEVLAPDANAARSLAPSLVIGGRIGEGVCLARDLAATPGQDLTPEGLAARAREIGKNAGAKVEVFGVPQMERFGMGAVLAVGRGSVNPPRFIVLDRAASSRGKRGKARTVVVIGKGVTFDTGGISLKPREGMQKMKYDMSGAAAVLGLFHALPAIEPGVRVIGLIPSAENMPGGRALKPGDIVRALDGTSIEVTNTDAEGRLLLADALSFAKRYQAEAVVDLATLTGSIGIALGSLAAGMFCDDASLAGELQAASATTGERLWRMPMWDEYAPEMRSDSADILNSAAREGGACLAAVFLKRFAAGQRWAHLDIASTAWSPVDRPHERRGPTGFGVRLLLEWIANR